MAQLLRMPIGDCLFSRELGDIGACIAVQEISPAAWSGHGHKPQFSRVRYGQRANLFLLRFVLESGEHLKSELGTPYAVYTSVAVAEASLLPKSQWENTGRPASLVFLPLSGVRRSGRAAFNSPVFLG
jgi:hypothetical protein